MSHLDSPFIKSDNKCVLTSLSCIIFAMREVGSSLLLLQTTKRGRGGTLGNSQAGNTWDICCVFWIPLTDLSLYLLHFPVLSLSSTLLSQSLVIFLPWRGKKADKRQSSLSSLPSVSESAHSPLLLATVLVIVFLSCVCFNLMMPLESWEYVTHDS